MPRIAKSALKTQKEIDSCNTIGVYRVEGDNLYLRVQATKNGIITKSWIVRYQFQKTQRRKGIGSLKKVSLKEARSKATEFLAPFRNDGIDPEQYWSQKKQEADQLSKEKIRKSITFDYVAQKYIDSRKSSWKNAKHAKQWDSVIKRYANPVIGNKSVADITPDDIRKILDPIWDKKTETANRVRSHIENILSYAKGMSWRSGENPAQWRDNLKLVFPAKSEIHKVIHQRALPYKHVPEFIAHLRTKKSMTTKALEFLILTATRSTEVREAVWSEIDFNKKIWTIPATRMKTKAEHIVPLSDGAIKLLESIRGNDSNYFIFLGSKAKRPLSDMTLSKFIKDNKGDDPDSHQWTDNNGRIAVPHGFRSSFRDWAAEKTNYQDAVIEKCLAHTVGNQVERTYRRTDFLEKRRTLMQQWSKFCCSKVN